VPLYEDQDVEPSPPSMSASRKRKLPNSFNGNDRKRPLELKELESDPEDEIHLFRRVHIKARKKSDGVRWSALNKHPFLTLDRSGLEISLTHSWLWPADVKGLAVHADRHFDRHFFYFELTVLDLGIHGKDG